jgi:uncharacterized membrane protein YfcA
MLKKKKPIHETDAKSSLTSLIVQNFIIGIIIGLVGAGGGFLIAPTFIIFNNFNYILNSYLYIIKLK